MFYKYLSLLFLSISLPVLTNETSIKKKLIKKSEASQSKVSVCTKITQIPVQVCSTIMQLTRTFDIKKFQEQLSEQLIKHPYG